MKGNKIKQRAFYWHFPHYNGHPNARPSSVIRDGDWKLIISYDPEMIELYNLKDDLGERNNLAKSNPAKVKELKIKLEKWLNEVEAERMKPNPLYMK